MPKKKAGETIRCRHFTWILRRRGTVYTADGRRSRPSLGRASLGTRDQAEALEHLHELDRAKAVELGLIAPAAPDHDHKQSLELKHGAELYLKFLARPTIAGGACESSRKRYKAVLDKFVGFARERGISGWEHVTRSLAMAYLTDLERRTYSERSIFFEGTLLKQVLKWASAEGYLEGGEPLVLSLRRVHGTTTYCWKSEEVSAMLDHCRKAEGLGWLYYVLVVLAHTGLRISEAVALRWSDVDLAQNRIRITNDRWSAHAANAERRRTKNRRDRWFPIHDCLRPVLERMPHAADGRVLHGPWGGVLKADTVRNLLVAEVLTPLQERFPSPTGEPGFRDGRLHSFRHFFCSRCANEGVPERMLMGWLGHRDSAMIAIYYHMHDEDAQLQMKKVRFADAFGSGVVAEHASVVPKEPHDSRPASAS